MAPSSPHRSDPALPIALDEDDDPSSAEVIVSSMLVLPAEVAESQVSDEWSFVADLEVVESVQGTFHQQADEDSWAMDEPSEEVARGDLWADSAILALPPEAPRVASENAPPVPTQQLVSAVVVGSGSLIAASGVLAFFGIAAGAVVGWWLLAPSPAPPASPSTPTAAAPAPPPRPAAPTPAPIEPPPAVEAPAPAAATPPEAEPTPVAAPEPAPVATPEPAPVPASEPIAAPEPTPSLVPDPEPVPEPPPPADAGPERPEKPRKRGLFGRRR